MIINRFYVYRDKCKKNIHRQNRPLLDFAISWKNVFRPVACWRYCTNGKFAVKKGELSLSLFHFSCCHIRGANQMPLLSRCSLIPTVTLFPEESIRGATFVGSSGHLPYTVQRGLEMAGSTLNEKSARRSRGERLEARISRNQKALFQRAADLQGRTLTDFVVSNLQDAALRTIQETQIIKLSAEDSRAFALALARPRSPNQKLRVAARRYMKLIGG
jgi:uncharacterized protein (DUF1778 family)